MGKYKEPDGLIIRGETPARRDTAPATGSGARRIETKPPPPNHDVLRDALSIEQHPRVILPRRKRLDSWLDGFLNFLRSDEEQHRQIVHQTIADLIAMAWPRAKTGLQQKGWITSKTRPIKPLRHVQQLIEPFETMIKVPPQLAQEHRALEILLATILREFAKKLSEQHGRGFIFETSARLHGLLGYKYERMLKHITHSGENFETLQEIFNNYYHASYYYYFSLLSRDFPLNEGTLFGLYCRANFFMARLDRDGTLRPQPVPERLPTRPKILFLLSRDKALRRRYGRDPDYAAKIRALVRVFPE